MGLYVLKFPARRILQPIARGLAWLHPDVLSYAAVGVAVGTAACYLGARQRPWLLLLAVGLVLVRMALNTLDGVIAIRRGRTSRVGEIVNALPDRYSDLLLVGGIALSGLCRPIWGVLGLASMVLVSYTGMLGKAAGVAWQHHGPLGKVERLILVMVFSAIQFLHLRSGAAAWWLAGLSLTPLEGCLLAFVVLGQFAVFNRVRGMTREIARLEWQELAGRAGRPRRSLVVYDSVTGNTAKVARAIADALGADLRRADDTVEVDGYDVVVAGSPVMSSEATGRTMAFLRRNDWGGDYALFFTYGAPGWGPISARKAKARIVEETGRPPVATFRCKGYHQTLKTYRGRPNQADLLRAFLFGVRLAKTRARS